MGSAAAVVGSPATAQTRSFDIAAQDAAAGLAAFAQQAGVQVVAPQSATHGKRTAMVKGELSVSAALDQLLKGSGLEVSSNDGRAIAVRAQRPQSGDLVAPQPLVVDEVVVTGSLIRGAAPAGAHLKVMDGEDIRRTGVSTLAEALQTSPQVFRGAAQEASVLANQGGRSGVSFSLGTSLDLRGVGADATLVLVNGRRLAPAGYGDFVDVSAIPASAVSRVEILSDGASATYGSDALAGVINIFLKRDFEGVQTEARAAVADGYREGRVGATAGKAWAGGHVLGGYEYYERGELEARKRPFAASQDLRPFGGRDYRSPYGLPGTILSPSPYAGAVPQGLDGRAGPGDIRAGQINLLDLQADTFILPEQKRHSVFLSIEHEASDRFSVYAEGLFADRRSFYSAIPVGTVLQIPQTNYYRQRNGFTGSAPINMNYNFVGDFGGLDTDGRNVSYSVVGGARFDLWKDWRLDAFGSAGESRDRSSQMYPDIFGAGSALTTALASSDPATAFNPFGDGGDNTPSVVASLIVPYVAKTRSTYQAINAKADGSLFNLPAGAVRLAVGGEFRWEEFDQYSRVEYRNRAVTPSGLGGERQVGAVFGEVFVPVVGPANAMPLVRRLEVSASARYDHYDDFGSSTNPKVGATWEVVDGLQFHGSWGTSFKAPRLYDLYSQSIAQLYPMSGLYGGPDPNGDGQTTLLLMQGGNRNLTAETGEAWTAGFKLAPRAWEGFSANLTYFNLSFDQRISRVPSILAPVQNPGAYLGSVYFLNPSLETVQAYIASADRLTNSLPTDTPVEGIILAGVANVSQAELQGLDLEMTQSVENDLGRFTASANLTWYLRYISRFSPTAPEVTVTDYVGFPVDLRGRFGLVWSRKGWGASVFANYTDDYLNNTVTPNRKIKAQTTFDVQAAYSFGEDGPGFAKGVSASVSVNNLFNQDPPFAEYMQVGYDAHNYSPVGRLVSVNLTKRW